MKNLRTIASLLTLISFCFIAGGSFDGDDLLFIFILILVGIPISYLGMHLDDKRAEKEQKALEEKKKEMEKENSAKLKMLKASFANVTKVVNYDHKKFIIIDEHKEIIMINETLLKFRDIIDYTISDNSQIIHSATISNTSTNTGSMLGRSIVGGVVGGGIGAMIGGSTAKKTTITQGGTSTTSHDYKICVTIDSISNPTIMIELGNDEEHLREIESLLCIIVTRNNKK